MANLRNEADLERALECSDPETLCKTRTIHVERVDERDEHYVNEVECEECGGEAVVLVGTGLGGGEIEAIDGDFEEA